MKKSLIQLKNVGPATLKDLELLGLATVDELAQQDPTDLFHRLEKITQARQDPCVWDVFAAIIDEAKTGEGKEWWHWTKQRKNLIQKGLLVLHL